MLTRKNFGSWKLPALLMLAALSGCSTTYESQAQPTPKLQVTPLPAEILQIDTSSSQPILQRAQQWLQDLEDWLKNGMPKQPP